MGRPKYPGGCMGATWVPRALVVAVILGSVQRTGVYVRE